jgi:hypothetical protein
MTNSPLTKDERLCLQFWFRQAIADLETKEATQFILQQYPPEEGENGGSHHRKSLVRRRTYRAQKQGHGKELVY